MTNDGKISSDGKNKDLCMPTFTGLMYIHIALEKYGHLKVNSNYILGRIQQETFKLFMSIDKVCK